MKLFGLKDENGKEYVLNVRAANPDVYQATYAEPIEPTPKFKVGDWVMISRTGTICSTHEYGNQLKGFNGQYPDLLEPLRIIDIKPIDYQPKAHIVEQNDIPYIFSSSRDFRLATSSEIESHLIKVAEKKGFVKGRKFKSIFSDDGKERKLEYFYLHQEEFKWRYFDNIDALHCDNGMVTRGGFCSNPFIYKNGQWCPIIPDKKPLPKTKKELMDFLGAYCNRHCKSVQEFLDEYED